MSSFNSIISVADSDSGGDNDSGPAKLSPAQKPARIVQIGIGVAALLLLNDAVSLALMVGGIMLPGAVASLVILLIVLIVSPGNHVALFLQPAADLLLAWLPLLFVPALVDFPMIVSGIPAWDYPKIAVIVVVGVLFTSSIGGWSLVAIGYLHSKCTGFKQASIFPEQSRPAAHAKALFGRRTLIGVLAASTVMTIVFAAVPGSRPALLFAIMLLIIPATYAAGQYLARAYPNGVCPNPILVSGAFSILMVFVLSLIGGSPFLELLARVHSSASINLFDGLPLHVGAGDVYHYLLSASVVSMALPVYNQKHALFLHGIDMLLASAIVAASSMLFTIGLCKLMFVSKPIARSMVLRTVTAPIAMASITFIHGLAGVAGAVSVITGICGGVVWRRLVNLRWNKFSSSLVRGFAVGSSCHGMGTAILSVDEPESTPFSTVAFVAVGVVSSGLISLPAARTLIELML